MEADSPAVSVDAREALTVLADARGRAADIVDMAEEKSRHCEAGAWEKATVLLDAAEALAAHIRSAGRTHPSGGRAPGRGAPGPCPEAGAALKADASAQAEAAKEAADRQAADTLAAAETEGRAAIEEATAHACQLREEAQLAADKELNDAGLWAEQLTRAARRDVEAADARLRAAEVEAERIRS